MKLLPIRQLKLYMPLCIWLVPQISGGNMKGVSQEMSIRIFSFVCHCSSFSEVHFPLFSQELCVVQTNHLTLTIYWDHNWMNCY